MRSLLTGVILALLGVAYAGGLPRPARVQPASAARGSLDEMLEGARARCDAFAGDARLVCLAGDPR